MEHTILLLEDDVDLIDGLTYSLGREGYTVDVAQTVRTAYACLEKRTYSLLLLDITLPDGNGVDVCRFVRERGNQVPIIFLTAMDDEVNVIRGLDSGADDYVTKPFKLGELCSRIRALLRRSGISDGGGENRLSSGPLSMDLLEGSVFLNNQPLGLTNTEYRLLSLLVRNAGRTVLRNTILDALWDGNGNFVDDNTLSVYIHRLRESIEEDPSKPAHLLTVRGFGYMWRP
ncbi:MAG: response regulator transcription factor [Lachnospiraceae bacterium]|nr:response regulator transcription factor [Lachnospiraceae bacterium]